MTTILEKKLQFESINRDKINFLMREIRANQQDRHLKINTFQNLNTLEKHMTIEENILFQCRFKNFEEIAKIIKNSSNLEIFKNYIDAFKNFLPKQLPSDLINFISISKEVLKNTDYLIYTTPVISEEEMGFIHELILAMKKNHKNFIHINDVTFSQNLETHFIHKKAA